MLFFFIAWSINSIVNICWEELSLHVAQLVRETKCPLWVLVLDVGEFFFLKKAICVVSNWGVRTWYWYSWAEVGPTGEALIYDYCVSTLNNSYNSFVNFHKFIKIKSHSTDLWIHLDHHSPVLHRYSIQSFSSNFSPLPEQLKRLSSILNLTISYPPSL